MSVFPFGEASWVVLVLTLASSLGAAAMGVVWTFEGRLSRLPDATRLDDLRERAASMDEKIKAREEELRRLNQQIHDRDRLASDALVLGQRVEALRAELAGLAGAEQQIEEMKRRATDAAEGYAAEMAKCDEARTAREEMERGLRAAGTYLATVQRDIEVIGERIKAGLTRFDEVQEALRRLEDKKTVIEHEIAGLESTREILFSARDEAAAIVVRHQVMQQEVEAIKDRIKAEAAQLDELYSSVQTLKDERGVIRREIAAFESTRQTLFNARDEAAAIVVRNQAMQQEIEAVKDRIKAEAAQLDDLHSSVQMLKDERAAVEREIAKLQGAHESLLNIREEVTILAARKEAAQREIEILRTEIEALKKNLQGRNPTDPQPTSEHCEPAGVVRDLLQMPACLQATWSNAHPAQREEEALHDVTTRLERDGLHYGQRAVLAFHTALKINDAAQLTVLAGVSGTGKSLLPRRYAEAMGLRFLQIAVEPRWDSPQDLLGFYNYIEKGYRATDLARALVQMDPHNTSGLADQAFDDQILLVLLDEMNLARVEYYFSEFLSRLEVRPRYGSEDDAEKRSGANLPIDVPGRADGPIRLFPSHNVLFAGTMNDDESTQSLSDKVLDRSNVLQFAAPGQFTPAPAAKPVPKAMRHRSFSEWRTWVRDTGQLGGGERDKAMQVIRRLAGIMEDMGRPFGHRLSEAILAYVANYPLLKDGHVNTPLADQVELRILPKLRGLTIDEHQRPFDELGDLVEKDLDDRALAGRLRDLINRQGSGTGQFNWRGFNRESA